MNRKAIYTCVLGAYDDIRQPHVIDAGFDYILFVRRGTKRQECEGVWQIREFDIASPDNTIASRYPKMNPHILLSEYEYTVWMDGNLVIQDRGFYTAVDKKIEEGVDYAGVKHPDKTCVYEDLVGCMHAMRDTPSNIWRAARFLVRVNFPCHYGMYENNIILRRTESEKVRAFNEMWWNLYEDYPRRDQFTTSYCLREQGITFSYLFPEGESAKTSPSIDYIRHNEKSKSILRCWYDFFACRLRTYALILYLKMHRKG